MSKDTLTLTLQQGAARFAEWVRTQGHTRAEQARRLNCEPPTIAKYETGRSPLPPSICAAMGLCRVTEPTRRGGFPGMASTQRKVIGYRRRAAA